MTQGAPQATPASTEVVTKLFNDVISGKAVDMAADLFTSDVVDHHRIVLTEPGGPGSVETGLKMLLNAFPDLKATVQALLCDGGTVVARFELAGTNTGDYRHLSAPTGRFARWEAIGIFRIGDGRIAEIWGNADRMGMLTQLGLLPDIG